MGNCPIFCKKSIIFATLFGCWAWFLKGPLWPDVREMCLLNGVYYSEIGPFGPEYTPGGRCGQKDHLWLALILRPTISSERSHASACHRARLICARAPFVGLIPCTS